MAAATLTYDSIPARSETPISMTSVSDGAASPAPTSASFFSSQSLLSSIRYLYCRDRPLTSSEQRDAALNLSLYTNVAILITKAVAFMHKKSFSEAVAVLKSFEKKVLPRTTRCTRASPSPSDHTSLLILRAGSLRVL